MYQIGTIVILWAFSAFLAYMGLLAIRIGGHVREQKDKKVKKDKTVGVESVISMAFFVLAILVNSSAVYVAYKYAFVVEGIAAFMYYVAVMCAVLLSLGLVFYLMISSIVWMLPKRRGLV